MTIDHPGVFIAQCLDAKGWSQADLAWVMGAKPQGVNAVINGRRCISVAMAVSLSEALGTSAETFLSFQAYYSVSIAKRPDRKIKIRAQELYN